MRDVAGEAKARLREDDVGDFRIFQHRGFDHHGFQLPTEALLHDGNVVLPGQDVGSLRLEREKYEINYVTLERVVYCQEFKRFPLDPI